MIFGDLPDPKQGIAKPDGETLWKIFFITSSRRFEVNLVRLIETIGIYSSKVRFWEWVVNEKFAFENGSGFPA